ncbi:MAG: hypothetical protein P8175_14165, partial [Deltaproteobacteria bacterium]
MNGYRSKVFAWGSIPGKGRHLFFSSKAPGLVFSATYLRGKLAPSAFPVLTNSGRRGILNLVKNLGEDRAAAS